MKKKAQATPISSTTKLIGVIILSVALLLIIMYASREKLSEILVSKFT